MTAYSEIVEMPDGNKLFIHYGEGAYPIWIEYVNTKTDKSVKLFQKENKTRKRRLRKKENYTRKLTHRAIPYLPADGSW
jgi:hypothetical protein